MYWNGPYFHSYPDATEEELQVDDVCIICRETMTTAAKKLPCNHIFHTTCLRSWFQRQQTCPTCRRDVLRAAPTPPQATPPQPPQPPQAQPPQNSMSKNFTYFFNFLRNSNFWNTRYKWFVFFNLILVFGGMAGMPPQMWPQPPVQPHQPNVAQPGWLRFVFSIRKMKKFIQCM